jgi:UPF0271 protein
VYRDRPGIPEERRRTYHRDVRIDLGADLGEWTGDDPARLTDLALLDMVTSVHVACGAHAGDPQAIEQTVASAAAARLAIGAHPGYPDRAGFGRRDLDMTPGELGASLRAQIGAIADACLARGTRMTHVKVHGALYASAARDTSLARVVADAVAVTDPALALVGPPGSALLRAARDVGLRPVAEAFADRAYEPDGSLRSRSLTGAVHVDPAVAAAQAVSIARDGRVRAHDGSWRAMTADTICVHGDTPGVVAIARAAREALVAADIRLLPFAER